MRGEQRAVLAVTRGGASMHAPHGVPAPPPRRVRLSAVGCGWVRLAAVGCVPVRLARLVHGNVLRSRFRSIGLTLLAARARERGSARIRT